MTTRTSTIFLQGLKDLSDRDAWSEFDGRYRPLLIAVARRHGLSASDAEDAAQEAIAAFIVDYPAGRYRREMGRLRDWLSGIMTHKVRDAQRRLHRQRALTRDSADADSPDTIEDTSIRATLEAERSQAVLRECLDRVRQEVAPLMYECFELFALQQRPAAQVARRLGISADLVYQNKRRVLLRIRELLPQIEESW